MGGRGGVSSARAGAAALPYALLDFANYSRDVEEQSRMVRNAGLLPYTNQYIGVTKYGYDLKPPETIEQMKEMAEFFVEEKATTLAERARLRFWDMTFGLCGSPRRMPHLRVPCLGSWDA